MKSPLLLAVILALTCSSAAASKPHHIVSLNLCTDELLLDLVPTNRVASVTYLARSASNSYRWAQAARVPVNHGSAEEIVAEKPDLIVAGTYTTSATRSLLRQAGIPVLEVEPANSFAEIRTITRRVASALGESARGEQLLTKMDATLDLLARTKPEETIRVAGWDGAGSVPGKGSLFDAILTAAGGVNIASSQDGSRRNSFDIERLLVSRPDMLAYGADSASTPSLRTDSDQHPLILQLYAHRRISYPEALYTCGLPESAGAAEALRAKMMTAMKFPAPR